MSDVKAFLAPTAERVGLTFFLARQRAEVEGGRRQALTREKHSSYKAERPVDPKPQSQDPTSYTLNPQLQTLNPNPTPFTPNPTR